MKIETGRSIYLQAAAFSIRYPVFVVEQAIPREEEFDELDCQMPIYSVLFDNNLPVATARFVEEDADDTFRVSRVATLKPYRGMGYGRLVVEAIEQVGKDKGYKHCLIHADCTALPFYQSMGYQVCSDLYIEDGVECVHVDRYL